MTDMTEAHMIANLTGAIAHLLTGRPGRHREFIDNVNLMVGGRELGIMALLHFAGRVREDGKPFIWVNLSVEQEGVPAFSLIAQVEGQTQVFELCMPFMSPTDSAAALVPDGFNMGAFRFVPDLQLRRIAKAPKRCSEAARTGIAHAYERLVHIGSAQAEAGERFDLPCRAQFRAAAWSGLPERPSDPRRVVTRRDGHQPDVRACRQRGAPARRDRNIPRPPRGAATTPLPPTRNPASNRWEESG